MLPPGFMVVHGNHPEALRDLLLAWMQRHPLAPLEDEQVLVQSNGVAQWIRLSLARDVLQGGAGIAAALKTELPSAFLWRAYRSVLGDDAVPATSPFDKSLLVWRLMRLLPQLLAEPVFAPLARFLQDDSDLRKRHQLAERLADLFDQYQVYRADWLASWAQGEDEILTSRGGLKPVPPELRWQPRLWRALQDDVGDLQAGSSRAAVHQRFLARAAQIPADARPHGLPRRLVMFGVSSLPQQSLEVLAALSRWVQVLMCVHNPSEHDWSHILADKDLLRAEVAASRRRRRKGSEGFIPEDQRHLHAHPLLAAWGKQGRDFIRLLDQFDSAHEQHAKLMEAIGQRIDCFDANQQDSLLRQLQDDIRELRPLAESRALWQPLDARKDFSIRFHQSHGPQREVEVLHDQLLAAFAADPSLRPRDVIVMVPDVAAYAPHIQAVFGLLPPEDARYIPFSVADQAQRHHDPLLGALERLLALPQSRIATSDVLDWLEVPAVRERFGIEATQLPLLHRWVRAANVRWGLHAQQRQSLDLPEAGAQNSWDFGLARMLLGYAVGSGQAWEGIEPLDEVGGLEAALLGPLVQFVSALETHWRQLAEPATPLQWGERLRALLEDFFAPQGEADGFTLRRLQGALQDWLDACAAAGLHDEALPLPVVREHWLAQIDQPTLNRPFFAGSVTFATLLPMRAIPFRVVALLGMNDGDYPRTRAPADFDLMGQDYRPGDRSRREDDRYLFLEALLSARERLHISWVGRSIHDHSERPPSVLVAQLRDHIAAGWRHKDDEALAQEQAGERLLHALTVEHKLQPFDPAYFHAGADPRLFSHAHEWRAAAAPDAAEAAVDPHLPSWRFEGPLTLRLLGDFLRNPARSFFRLRLGIFFEGDDPAGEDQEPFQIDGLQNWRLQDELIRAQTALLDTREGALQVELERMARRGDLPDGPFGELVQEDLAAPMDKMFGEYTQALAEWPQALADEALDVLPPGEEDESLRLSDWLGQLRANAAGERCRLLLDSGSMVKGRSYRRDRLVPFWVAHLAAHVAGQPMTTLVVSKAGKVRLAPLSQEQALAHWRVLLQAWSEGLRRPLPLALHSALAWVDKGGSALGTAHAEAFEAARSTFEDHDPRFGRRAERDDNDYLARAFADFDALWHGGEFARWSEGLIKPMSEAVGKPPREAAE
ncbi:exodeoxyribonuclease V subunit gamma [Variovorax sp. OV329]|uniref:exodeoxyribonuclease V subunit gamma n=1 Tax=Variovorax sp. OV329 TaxID=1882825 RepID=UPI000B85EB5D|nr:exodeoxyribonuclease V subunit gamma [Variovorax sp. OV329]